MMRNKILIFGDYPTKDNIKDGMIQRIKAVDDELSSYFRIYVKLSLKAYVKKEEEVVSSSVKVYRLNVLLHYFFLVSLIKQVSVVYFHSIFNYWFAVFFSFRNVKKRILDLHGSVPEEAVFQGEKKWVCRYFAWLEKQAIRECNYIICVSHNMKEHIQRKYLSSSHCHFIIKPIIPTNTLVSEINKNEIEELRQSLGLTENDVVILYSGNLQKWQNWELMISLIEKTRDLNYHYIILTGQKEEAICQLKKSDNDLKNVFIDCVSPKELYKYYAIANYGFLLRDEHVLNNVASPTKLIEYLYYGIIPILKYENVGDKNYYNYEYVKYDSSDFWTLTSQKSIRNSEIAKMILNNSVNTLIKDLL